VVEKSKGQAQTKGQAAEERRVFHNDEGCPIRNVVAQIGDKWSMLILFALVDGKDRFNSLKSRIIGISQRMLTQTLRDLEREGYVERTVYPEVPVKVEYELTPMGKEIVKPLYQLVSWAESRHDKIKQSRIAYDKRS
jgi:DNA-binding HxlR family transcriptional regulator